MDNFILAYYQRICDGSEVVGKWIRMLYDKIVSGIEDGTYHFDQRKANNAIRFFEKFVRHNKGVLAPQVIVLTLWQKAMLSVIYGIVDENGKRIFREARDAVFSLRAASPAACAIAGRRRLRAESHRVVPP